MDLWPDTGISLLLHSVRHRLLSDLLTAVEAVTTDGSFPRSKPLQTAFLARIFCEK